MHSHDLFLKLVSESVSDFQYASWFGEMKCVELSPTEWRLDLPTEQHVSWLSSKFMAVLQKCADQAAQTHVRITFAVAANKPFQSQLDFPMPQLPYTSNSMPNISQKAAFRSEFPKNNGIIAKNINTNLNPEYSFDNFVVGGSNEFAHGAAKAVAEEPAGNFNPLFIYGGVGLGKTHLMQAIGNALRNNFGMRVLYLTSEQFTNDLVTSLGVKTAGKANAMAEFRERYRTQCDVLMIDDIQFIAGKQSTQEELFHTFNALHQNHKQIVLSSDKPPQEIPDLEERLKSRFVMGLLADIQAPDYETRMAILQKKAERDGVEIPNDVIQLLASRVTSNIRELEGTLRSVEARAKLSKERVSMRIAQQVLDSFGKQFSNVITAENVIKAVCAYYNVSGEEILSKVRSKPIVLPRQIAMYLSYKHTGLSYPVLGRVFKKDHTSVINAYKKIEEALPDDERLAFDIARLEDSILDR